MIFQIVNMRIEKIYQRSVEVGLNDIRTKLLIMMLEERISTLK